MTLDERRNEVLRSHAAFLNALGVAAAGGGGFVAIANANWNAAVLFVTRSAFLHLGAAEILSRLRVTP